MKFAQWFLFLFLSWTLSACAVNPPVQEYTIARTALTAAQTSGAGKYAPGLWFKAEENYRQGETAFQKGDFDVARQYFTDSQDFSERAENKARYDKRKLGEELPQ
jgi:hypothetical protein